MVYVIIQFILLVLIAISADWTNLGVVSVILFVFSTVLGVWTVFTVGIEKVRVMPDLRKGAYLVTHGPYKLVRHPMYSAVLILCSGLVLSNPSWYMVLGFVLLLFDLVFKLRYEEKMLLEAFPEYKKYKIGTYYFIPFVY